MSNSDAKIVLIAAWRHQNPDSSSWSHLERWGVGMRLSGRVHVFFCIMGPWVPGPQNWNKEKLEQM